MGPWLLGSNCGQNSPLRFCSVGQIEMKHAGVFMSGMLVMRLCPALEAPGPLCVILSYNLGVVWLHQDGGYGF